jgi:hypothetical protein
MDTNQTQHDQEFLSYRPLRKSSSPAISSTANKYLIIILASYLFLSFFMITKFPKVWMDTSWSAITPYNLAKNGKLANPIITGFDHREDHVLAPTIVYSIIIAPVYKLFGLGIVQGRVVSILMGFLLLCVTYFFTRSYYDNTIALLAIILLASDNVFFVTSRTVRADIYVAFIATAGFFLFIYSLDKNSLKLMALSGLFAGISLYTHPNAFLVVIAIIVLFLIKYKLSLYTSKYFWTFISFLFIGFLPYALYVIIIDYPNHFANFHAQLSGRTDHYAVNLLAGYFQEYKRYDSYIYFPKRLIIFLVQIGALSYAALSKRKIDKHLCLLVLLFVVLLPVWNPSNPTPRYFITIMSPICILVSVMFVDLYRKISLSSANSFLKHRKQLRVVFLSIGLLFFANQALGNVYILWKHKDNNYYSFIEEIQHVIPKGASVWGSISFWIGLHDHPYLTQISPFHEVLKFKPEYAILYDSETWGDVSVTVGRKAHTAQSFAQIRMKMEQLCQTNGILLKQIQNPYYGDVYIYRIKWHGL